MPLKDRLKEWYQGTPITDPHTRHYYPYKRHWTAKVAFTLVKCCSAHWQFCLMFALALGGVIAAYLAL